MMKTLCIDPGHGGEDPGAMGPNGLKESAVVLAVALLLKAELIGEVEVVMTREVDVFVELTDRAKFANDKKADVFLSIHANSATRPVMGIETFINRNTTQSFPLGEHLQDEMIGAFPGHNDRGLKRAGYLVLRRTSMAAALVELEFIHVEAGEEHLRDRKVQARYAKALARAVRKFLGIDAGRRPDLPAEPDEPVACPALKMADRLRVVAAEITEIANMAEV